MSSVASFVKSNKLYQLLKSDNFLEVLSPLSGDVIGKVPLRDTDFVSEVVAKAKIALPSWSALTASKRSHFLMAWYNAISEHTDDIAQLLSAEQGKPIHEAKGEVTYAAAFVKWFAEEARRIYGKKIPSLNEDTTIDVVYEPVGVCAAITPWNFPAAMITRKAAAALAAGSVMVVKPSELTPLTAYALVKLAHDVGIPNDALAVVTGEPEAIGSLFCSHKDIRKVSFTGSTRVGRLLMSQSASSLKRLSFELGGNAPFIVSKEADIELATKAAIHCKFRNAGQTCISANRFYVHEDVHDAFIGKLKEHMTQLVVGNSFEQGVDIGPLINQNAIEKIKSLLVNAVDLGAKVLMGGKVHPLGGTFFEPTLITNVNAHMAISTDEIFGPVVAIQSFETIDDVIEQANNTEYGLAAYIFSEDKSEIATLTSKLEYGMVGVNVASISSEATPFGGVKASGFGREGSFAGIYEYLSMKAITTKV